ncbi:MAG: glycosyltransferase family 1 protein [bacterium]|nr:glycosyltransferase family 1 protein [bacterium]
MRIALTLLSGIGYGGATYFRHLLPALATAAPEHEFHCFVPRGHRIMEEVCAPNITYHAVLGERTSALDRFRFEQHALPRELARMRADIVYTAKNITIFRAPCPQVIAIRNMEPFRYRAFANAPMLDTASRVKWELTKRSLRAATGIIAVSAAVRDAVVERFPDAERKVTVVYNGTPAVSLRGVGDEAIPVNVLLTASKFVAYANQLTLLEAYAILCRERSDVPELHFAGGIHDRTYFAAVQRRAVALGIGGRIRMLGLLPQDDLHARMRRACVFVFPSMLESCPHTLLEAMACGVPIAVSATPPMPEICGDAAVYFDPRAPAQIARTISRLLDDAALRARLVVAGRVRAQHFTWEQTARGLLGVFARVAGAVPTP